MCRIELTDSAMSAMSAMMKMADGNPDAISAMMEIFDKHDSIDPQAAMGGFGAILMLDTYGIYGTDIYVLFNDKCGRDVRTMLMLMRATQLGLFPESRLKLMAADQMREVSIANDELSDLDRQVCEQLDQFAKPA